MSCDAHGLTPRVANSVRESRVGRKPSSTKVRPASSGISGGITLTRFATCACGQLSAACAAEPANVSLCHCLACQKRTGSTYGVAAFFQRRDVEPRGRAQSFTRMSESGHPVTFHFCPVCGSTVYWEPHRKPEMIAVAVGAFADPGFPQPSQAVNAEHRHSWVSISI